jgi:hypothetical protein
MQCFSNKFGRQAVSYLFLFIPQYSVMCDSPGNAAALLGACPQTPGVYRIGPMGRSTKRSMLRPGPSVPLASPAAPVALRQSRILRATRESHQ